MIILLPGATQLAPEFVGILNNLTIRQVAHLIIGLMSDVFSYHRLVNSDGGLCESNNIFPREEMRPLSAVFGTL